MAVCDIWTTESKGFIGSNLIDFGQPLEKNSIRPSPFGVENCHAVGALRDISKCYPSHNKERPSCLTTLVRRFVTSSLVVAATLALGVAPPPKPGAADDDDSKKISEWSRSVGVEQGHATHEVLGVEQDPHEPTRKSSEWSKTSRSAESPSGASRPSRQESPSGASPRSARSRPSGARRSGWQVLRVELTSSGLGTTEPFGPDRTP